MGWRKSFSTQGRPSPPEPYGCTLLCRSDLDISISFTCTYARLAIAVQALSRTEKGLDLWGVQERTTMWRISHQSGMMQQRALCIVVASQDTESMSVTVLGFMSENNVQPLDEQRDTAGGD